MPVLVTGASGWLGSRLVEMLVERGHKDVSVLLQGQEPDTFFRQLSVNVLRGDIRDGASLSRVCDGVDVVYHCAGLIHPRFFIRELYDVNSLGTKNILDAAISAGVRKFILVSSNSVAGANRDINDLFTETMDDRPYMHYGKSKVLAERFVKAAQASGKIMTTIVRPCWFYGLRQPQRQTTFFRMIKKGDPLVFGDGHNLRSLSYVDNIVEALIAISSKDVTNGKIYWIADSKPYSTLQIYKTIADLLKVKDFKPRFLPDVVSTACVATDFLLQSLGLYIKEIHVAGEMNKSIACSIKSAQDDFGYDPKITLEEGMRRSLEWCYANGVAI